MLQNPYDTNVATLPSKIKMLNFSEYSADMHKKCKQIDFKFTAFNYTMRVTMYVECIYVLTEYLKY